MALVTLLGVLADGPLTDGVLTNTAVQVDWPRGTDGVIELNLVDHDGQLVDLDLAGADRLELTMRSTLGGDPVLAKLAMKVSTAVGRYSFSIASADTIDLSGRVIMDVWATKAAAQQQVVAPSYFNVTPRMRAP